MRRRYGLASITKALATRPPHLTHLRIPKAPRFRRRKQCADNTLPRIARRERGLALSCRHNWATVPDLRRHSRYPSLYFDNTTPERATPRRRAIRKAGWSVPSFVLAPATPAGAQICVGLAGPHIQSRAIATPSRVLSPARYRDRCIRFDPPVFPAAVAELVSAPGRKTVGRLPHRLRSCCRHRAQRPAARRRLAVREAEAGAVDPHAVHDRRQLARHGDNGALVAAFGRQPQAQA